MALSNVAVRQYPLNIAMLSEMGIDTGNIGHGVDRCRKLRHFLSLQVRYSTTFLILLCFYEFCVIQYMFHKQALSQIRADINAKSPATNRAKPIAGTYD